MNLEINNLNPTVMEVPSAKKGFKPFKSLMVLSSVAVGLSLSSCIDPSYNPYGPSSQSAYNSGYNSGYNQGYRINSLPSGYRTENISGRTYYYHDGHYYQPNSGGYYTVVEAPRSSRYYTEYSRYRQPSSTTYSTRDGSYSRTEQNYDQRYQGTQIVSRLPSGYRVINHRGITYYQSGDRYYMRQANGYALVQRPY